MLYLFVYICVRLACVCVERGGLSGLLSSRDALADTASSWAAKSLLLGGWEVIEGLAKGKRLATGGKVRDGAGDGGVGGDGTRHSAGESGGEEAVEPQFIEDPKVMSYFFVVRVCVCVCV